MRIPRLVPGSLVAALLASLLASCANEPPRTLGATPSPVPVATGPTTQPSPLDLPPCDYPKKLKLPAWIPRDLPLPKGTTAIQRMKELAGYKRTLMLVRMPIEGFTAFVLERWPAAGWTLQAGEQEPGEIEQQFARGERTGALKAQAVFCDPPYSVLYLIYAPKPPKSISPITVPSGGTPLSPSPTG